MSDPTVSAMGKDLLHSICDFEFIFILFILNQLLSETATLSAYLQSENMDIFTAKKSGEATLHRLKLFETEEKLLELFEEAQRQSEDFTLPHRRIVTERGQAEF